MNRGKEDDEVKCPKCGNSGFLETSSGTWFCARCCETNRYGDLIKEAQK